MESFDKDDLLGKFFNGKLDPEEQQTFDRLLKEDAAFRQQVTFERNVRKAITLTERARLKQELQSFRVSKPSTTGRAGRWTLIAASFAGIILISYLAISRFSEQSAENLYTSYYQPYPNMIAPVSRGNEADSPEAEAFASYDMENYAGSARLFDQLYNSGKAGYALLYAGISYLETGQTDKAIRRLKVLSNTENDFAPAARWYLALAYLKDGNRQAAEEALRSLTNHTEFSEQARQLLEAL